MRTTVTIPRKVGYDLEVTLEMPFYKLLLFKLGFDSAWLKSLREEIYNDDNKYTWSESLTRHLPSYITCVLISTWM